MDACEKDTWIGTRRLRALLSGNPAAPPVVAIHGAGAHARWWDVLLPRLTTTHRVVAPDLRGHGASDWCEPPSYLIEDFAADVVAQLDDLAIERAVLLGHSMGGRVCSWIAAHAPQRVAALILLDTRMHGLEPQRVAHWRGQSTARGRERKGYESAEAAMATFRLTPNEPGVAPAVMRQLAEYAVGERDGQWMLRFDRAALDVHGSRIADFLPLLERIECPTLVIRGASSDVLGVDQSAAALARLRHGQLAEVPGGHHFLLAHPEAVSLRLASFLEGLRA